MEYLHMQQPISGLCNNITLSGVPVVLTAIDSKGAITDIGTATKNPYYETFSFTRTPPTADTYTILASYAGSASYGASTATTAVNIGAAAATQTPQPTQAPATDYMPTLTSILATVVVAIIVSVIALAVVLRKHA